MREAPFELRADRPAAESAYAALVRLVEQAQTQRAPFVRMADRYAGFFLPATLLIAGAAWAASGEAVRALAVVVVATPCPLILAAPIALVSGVSRAAKAGVIVKGAGVIETPRPSPDGAVRQDRHPDRRNASGEGSPARSGARADPELLRLAASLDRMSAHVLGEALVHQAEAAGLGARGSGGRRGGARPGHPRAGCRPRGGARQPRLRATVRHLRRRSSMLPRVAGGFGSGEARVFVAVDGRLGGVIVMADELRPDADTIVERLRSEGVRHVAVVSGDRQLGGRAGRSRARRRSRLRRTVTGAEARQSSEASRASRRCHPS